MQPTMLVARPQSAPGDPAAVTRRWNCRDPADRWPARLPIRRVADRGSTSQLRAMSRTSPMPPSPTHTNPLLEAWTTPFEAPPFDRFEPQYFRPAFDAAL